MRIRDRRGDKGCFSRRPAICANMPDFGGPAGRAGFDNLAALCQNWGILYFWKQANHVVGRAGLAGGPFVMAFFPLPKGPRPVSGIRSGPRQPGRKSGPFTRRIREKGRAGGRMRSLPPRKTSGGMAPQGHSAGRLFRADGRSRKLPRHQPSGQPFLTKSSRSRALLSQPLRKHSCDLLFLTMAR